MQFDTPEALGFDPGRLQRIDALLADRYVGAARLPHAQILIGRDDRVAHFASAGPARADRDSVVDERSLFRIASMTKPITSVAFMMLVEEGKVALDDPVERVIPEFAGLGVYAGGGGGAPFTSRPADAPMRMVDLLRHTSGLTYGFQYRTNVDAYIRKAKVENWRTAHDDDSFIAALAEAPLEFSPGAAWNYSLATDVLGVVVARVSGMRFDAFLESRIFAPLGMADTGFVVPDDKRDRLADAWAWTPGQGMTPFDRGADSLWSKPARFCSGGGGLVSSSADYHRFCRMMLNGGTLDGVRILGRKTVELMTLNHLPGRSDLASMSTSLFSETQNAGVGFGLGFAITQDPARLMMPGSPGEYYWGGMFSTAFFVDPVERLTMVFMTQLSPSSLWPIRRELKTLIYSALV